MRIYCGRPMAGQHKDAVIDYYCRTKKAIAELGYEVIAPIFSYDNLTGDIKFMYDSKFNHEIFRRARWLVEYSDLMYINFLGVNKAISVGCVMEIAWAVQSNKYVIVAMEPDNIHNHLFIHEAASIIFHNEADVFAYLKEIRDKCGKGVQNNDCRCV